VQGLDLYTEQDIQSEVEKLVRQHTPLVVKIAKSMKRKLPSHIELNDLLQSGFVGLIEANKKFKSDKGAKFETFASIRIKGAIIDDLRKNSWGNRGSILGAKELADATSRIEQRNKRPATAEEVAAELEITLEEYDKLCQRVNLGAVQNMDRLEELNRLPGTEDSPEDALIHEDLTENIKKILETCSERDRQLLSLYYIEELTFKEVAEVLSLTEARVCQLHAAAVAKIKRRLDV